MRDLQDLLRQTRSQRRALHAELCGSVYGCEYDGDQAFGADEDVGLGAA